MSKEEFDFFDSEELSNFEKLKAKYSGYGVDDDAIETISKNIERSNPDHNAFAEDFAEGFSDEDEEDKKETEEKEEKANSKKPDFSSEDEPDIKEIPEAGQETGSDISSVSDNPDDIYSYSDKTVSRRDKSGLEEFEVIPESDDDDIASYNQYNYEDDGEAEAEEASKAEKETVKKKKKKSHKLSNTLLVLFIIAVIWGALFAVDLVMVKEWKDPVFCIKTDEYTNGSVDYMGLFYKIQYHVDDNGNTNADCMPWFVEGPNAKLERKNISDGKKPAEEKKKVSPEDNLTIVSITVPEEFIEEDTSEGIELTSEQKKQGFKSVVLNKDNSVTYEIGKGDYENALIQLKADTGRKLDELAASSEYPSVRKVEYNDDFSSVSLYVDKAIYTTGLDRFCSVSVYGWSGYYQAFAKKDYKCELVIRDITDSSVIEESKG